jgi:hypothetical protein
MNRRRVTSCTGYILAAVLLGGSFATAASAPAASLSSSASPDSRPLPSVYIIAAGPKPEDQSVKLRNAFGLPTDAATLAQVEGQTVARLKRGRLGSAGFYMSDTEADDFDARQAADGRLAESIGALRDAVPGLLSASISLTLKQPTVQIVTAGLDVAAKKALDAKLTEITGIKRTRFVESPIAAGDASRLETLLADQSKLGSELGAVGVDLTGGGFDRDLIDVEIDIATAPTDSAPTADQTALVSQVLSNWFRSNNLPALPLRVRGMSRPILAASNERDDSPGQSKGGMTVVGLPNGATCTSAFGVMANGTQRLVTAGHCVGSFWGQGAAVNHHNSPVGVAGYCPDLTSPSTPCKTTSNVDYAFVDISPIAGSLPVSEYAFINPPGVTSANYLLPMTGVSTSTTSSSLSVYCLEGASPSRPSQIPATGYDESCALGMTPNGGFGSFGGITCGGDSGGLVRIGSTIAGVLRARVGAVVSGDCNANGVFTYAQSVVTHMTTQGFSPSVITADPSSNATYPRPRTRTFIRNSYGVCLSSQGSGWADGTIADQWGCISSNAAQLYGFVPAGSSYGSDVYRLVRFDGSNRTCLSVNQSTAGGGLGDGALLHYWGCIATGGSTLNAAQLWRLNWQTDGSSGWMEIRSVLSGRCISVPNSAGTPGAQIHLWGCIPGHAAQRWQIT